MTSDAVYGRFRNARYAGVLKRKIESLADGRNLRIVHVCGTHEDTISSSGIRSILPANVSLVAGPGCPVCVCAAQDVDAAIDIARQGHIVTTYGDMLRVPSTDSSLDKERGRGADVRIVYGVNESVEIARRNPDRQVIFVAVGFETTAPTVALEVTRNPPDNFSVLTSLKVIPPAMELLVQIDGFDVDGFVTPGHVSAITGTGIFQPIAEKYGIPCVAAGFEPLDVLEAIRMILVQIEEGRAESENEYSRVVNKDGNIAAQSILRRAFLLDNALWRGIGTIPKSGYFLRDEFAFHDARRRFELPRRQSVDILPGCLCHKVILGIVDPVACSLFGKRCTPEDPYGPCMVGHEGTCRIRYQNIET